MTKNLLNAADAAAVRAALGLLEPLAANRTYYVRPDGSNSNTGLANTAGGAWLTLQKAMDYISGTLDLGPYNVTVQVADGTYTTGLSLKSYRATSGTITFVGNETTPANCLISVTSANCFGNASGAAGVFTLKGFKLTAATSGWGMAFSGQGMRVSFKNIDFGACVTRHLEASQGAFVEATGNITVSGNALVGFWATRRGSIYMSNRTVTYLNSPAYGARHWNASEQGWIDGYGMTFVNGGTVTGKRYEVDGLGGIYTAGGGASYVPGDSAGSEANNGKYY